MVPDISQAAALGDKNTTDFCSNIQSGWKCDCKVASVPSQMRKNTIPGEKTITARNERLTVSIAADPCRRFTTEPRSIDSPPKAAGLTLFVPQTSCCKGRKPCTQLLRCLLLTGSDHSAGVQIQIVCHFA